MKRRDDLRRLLRWYPPSWRERYGEELLALVDDRLHEAPLTMRLRSSIAIAGVRERCYGSGLVGARSTPAAQRRTGSLTVLVAWSIMIVGGASLVKMAEHYSVALPSTSRAAATFAYDVTAAAGFTGTLLVLCGAVLALPGFVRFLRASKWPEVRRTFTTSLVASMVLVTATFALSRWARQLNAAQRNGSDSVYSFAFLAFALLVVVTIALWTRASIEVVSKIDFTPRELRWESCLALAVSLSSIVVVLGAVAWWVQMGLHAPWFLQGTVSGQSGSPWSARVLATGLVMALASAIALWGALRVAMTFRPNRVNAQ